MSSLILFALLLIVSLFTTALTLWIATRVVKSRRATFSRALAATFLLVLINIAIGYLSSLLPPTPTRDASQALIMALIPLGLTLLLATALFHRLFQLPVPRAAAVTGFLIGQSVLVYLVVVLIVRPYLFEMRSHSTNAMAPTIIGWHRDGACPKCGGHAVIGATPPGWERMPIGDNPEALCTNCLQVSKFSSPSGPLRSPDRFTINKRSKPTRWDIIAFQSWHDPKQIYAFRLVGLPGETLFLDQGAVWIDGQRMALPASVKAEPYPALRSDWDPGGRQNPIKLGPDEFFVLGDFSSHASDSRYNGPVPRNRIEGVADWCYWPPSRMRFLRP